MRWHVCVLVVAVLVCAVHAQNLPMCSWNIETFGDAFVADPLKVQAAVNVISRYTICCIQEIRDANGDALPVLMAALGAQYTSVVGARQGNTVSKEQYACIYKHAEVDMLRAEDYAGAAAALMSRPPHIVQFRIRASGQIFTTINMHTSPQTEPILLGELNALTTVFADVIAAFNDAYVVLLGDLNAGVKPPCTAGQAFTVAEKAGVTLFNDARWSEIIGDNIDTTVAATTGICAYDRFIGTTPFINDILVAGTANVYRYDLEFGYTPAFTDAVSDHYPIEMHLVRGLAAAANPCAGDWAVTVLP